MQFRSLLNCSNFDDLKHAALYFDRVLPINPLEFINYNLPPHSETYSHDDYQKDLLAALGVGLRKHKHVLKNLLLIDEDVGNSALDQVTSLIENHSLLLQLNARKKIPNAFINAQYILPKYHKVQQHLVAESLLNNEPVPEIGATTQQILLDLENRLRLGSSSLVLPEKHPIDVATSRSMAEVAYTQIKIADTSNVDWDQIIEIRRDAEAKAKLNRLRLQIIDLVAEKDTERLEAQIQDDLAAYEQALKKHGFSTVVGTLSSLLDWQNVVALAGATIGGSMLSQEMGAAVTASAFAIGQTTLAVVKHKNDKSEFVSNHPYSYYFDVVKPLADGPPSSISLHDA